MFHKDSKNHDNKKNEELKKSVPEEGAKETEILNEGETVVLSRKEYEELQAQADKAKESWDRMLRQQADFENIRKRMERDKQEFQKYACEDVIVDLLSILDDLERSVEAAEKGQENSDAFLKGIEMILAHLYDLLKERGVTPLGAKGEKFDPHKHEALMQTETTEHEDGQVIEELQKGYMFGDKVIRTAKVRVAKKIEEKK